MTLSLGAVIIIFICAFIWILFTKNLNLKDKITSCVAISALLFSVLSLFKEQLFPFQLKVVGRDVKLSKIIDIHKEIRYTLIVPIRFINTGFRTGVIDDFILIATDEKGLKRRLFSYCDIDASNVYQGKKRINQNIINTGSFPFSLTPGESVVRYPIFEQEDSSGVPIAQWIPGKYAFTIKVKTLNSSKLKEYSTFELDIRKKALEDLDKGFDAYIRPPLPN